jgi:hypothetical protein
MHHSGGSRAMVYCGTVYRAELGIYCGKRLTDNGIFA